MRRQSQILDETTRLTLRCVRWAKHAPVGRLKGPRSRDFASFLELGIDPGHHAESADVRKARKNLGDSLSLHLKALQDPVA